MEYQSPVSRYLRQDGHEIDHSGTALRVWDVYLPFAAKLKAFNEGGAEPIVLNEPPRSVREKRASLRPCFEIMISTSR